VVAKTDLDETSQKILKALGDIGAPAGCGDIAKKIGVPTSQVACRVAPLRKRGLIESPAKSKYALTKSAS
jgi:DNA-binding IclR family transcriptional regulator